MAPVGWFAHQWVALLPVIASWVALAIPVWGQQKSVDITSLFTSGQLYAVVRPRVAAPRGGVCLCVRPPLFAASFECDA